LNQHHVGGRRADHGPKHAPGVISEEGLLPANDGPGTIGRDCRLNADEISRPKLLDRDDPVTEDCRLNADEISRPKLLDRDDPVTEVWTLAQH
jgi:hypothetical protein